MVRGGEEYGKCSKVGRKCRAVLGGKEGTKQPAGEMGARNDRWQAVREGRKVR